MSIKSDGRLKLEGVDLIKELGDMTLEKVAEKYGVTKSMVQKVSTEQLRNTYQPDLLDEMDIECDGVWKYSLERWSINDYQKKTQFKKRKR